MPGAMWDALNALADSHNIPEKKSRIMDALLLHVRTLILREVITCPGLHSDELESRAMWC